MTVTIDAAGRIVVPKALREQLGLRAGAALEVRSQGGALILEPAPTSMRLVKRGGGVVAKADQKLPKLTANEVRVALETSRR